MRHYERLLRIRNICLAVAALAFLILAGLFAYFIFLDSEHPSSDSLLLLIGATFIVLLVSRGVDMVVGQKVFMYELKHYRYVPQKARRADFMYEDKHYRSVPRKRHRASRGSGVVIQLPKRPQGSNDRKMIKGGGVVIQLPKRPHDSKEELL